MQKQDPIDDLFRQGLRQYRIPPSPESRSAFMRDVGKNGKRLRTWWFLSGILGLILVGTGIAVLVSEGNRGEVRKEVRKEVQSTHGRTDGISKSHGQPVVDRPVALTQNGHKESVTSGPGSGLREQLNDNKVSAKPRGMAPAILASYSKPAKQAPAPVGGNYVKPSVQVPMMPEENATKSIENINREPVQSGGDKANESRPDGAKNVVKETSAVAKSDTVVAKQQQGDSTITIPAPHRDKAGLPKKWNISLGAYYTPEWMFNTLNGDKFVNNFGLEGTFHIGRYSVRTGVGLSITKGSNEMMAQTNPYLGKYNALDSIEFTWNNTYTKLVPTYYTSTEKVYDSVINDKYSFNKKRYTYLQVPLILGYDFWKNDWLSLGVRAGAVMSVLLKTENISGSFDPGMDRIITVNNVSPDRIALNWQAVGGINAVIGWSRRFSIEVEPEVRYYFNSVYESSVLTKKPWSIGIRTALIIKL